MKKMNKKGFTLAELLIVVAIIAVLVAIAIPVFTAQLTKSKEAADEANIRSAYAAAVADALTENKSTYSGYSYDGPALNYSGKMSWNAGTTLSVTYSASKIDKLELHADALG